MKNQRKEKIMIACVQKTIKFSRVFLYLTFFIFSSVIAAESAALTKLYSGFNSPVGMGFDSKGNLYIAEWGAGIVTRISTSGKRNIFAEGLNAPSGLAIDADDNIYVASYSDDIVYKFTHTGRRSLFVKELATPVGLSFAKDGNLLIANRATNEILSVSSDGKTKIVVSNLKTPVGVVQTSDGSYFVSNINGGISFKPPGGKVRTINSDFSRPGAGIVINNAGEVFVVDYGGTTVKQILPNGKQKVVANGLSSPVGLTLDKNGNLYVATWGDGSIYLIK